MVTESEAASLTARISATGVTSFKSKLRSAERSADSLGSSVDDAGGEMLETAGSSQILAGRLEQVSDKFRGLVGSATAAAGAVTGYGTAASGAAGASATLGTVITATLVPSLVSLGASAGTAAVALGGIATAAGAVASGAGLVVGSGLLAYSKDLATANREQLQTTQAKIRALERERQETGSLTQAQEKRLQNLREEANELEEASTKAGALSRRFAELKNTIGQQLLPVGQQFKGLIRDFVNGLPDVTQAVIDNLGPLGMFRDAIRDAGTAAAESLPRIVRGFLDIGRRAIPPLRDLAAWAGERLPSTFTFLRNTVTDVLPEFVELGKATLGLTRDFLGFGRTVTNAVVPSITNFLGWLEDLFEQFRALPQPVQESVAKFSVFAPAVLAAATAFTSLSGALAPVVNLFSRFIPLLARVAGPLGVLTGVALAVSRNFAGLRDDVQLVVGAFRDQLQPAIQTLNRTVVPIFNDIARAFGLTETNIVSSIDRLATAFAEQLAGSVRTAGQRVRGALRDIRSFWETHRTQVLSVIQRLRRTALSAVQTLLTRYRTRTDTALGEARTAWMSHQTDVVAISRRLGTRVIDTLRPMFRVLREETRATTDTIETVWREHGVAIRQTVRNFTSIVASVMRSWGTLLAGITRTATNQLLSIWEAHDTQLVAEIRATLQTVRAVFRGTMDVLIPLVRTSTSTMRSVWNLFGDDLVTIMRTTWTVITGVVSTALDAILTAIRVNMRAARGVVQTVMQLMRGDYSAAINTMLQTTRDILTTVRNFYERTFQGILTFVRQWGPQFIGAVRSILTSVYNAFVSFANDLIFGSLVPRMFDRILAVTNAWGTQFLSTVRSKLSNATAAFQSEMSAMNSAAQSGLSGIVGVFRSKLSSVESLASSIISAAENAADRAANALDEAREAEEEAESIDIDYEENYGSGRDDPISNDDDDDDDDDSGSFGGGGGDFRNDANDDTDDGSSGFVGLHRGGVTRSSGLAMLHRNEVVMGVDAGADALADKMGGGGPTIVVRNNEFHGADEDEFASALANEAARKLRRR